MCGPGVYRPDPTEGITARADLPAPEIVPYRRTDKRQPCPRCGHAAYRDKQFQRTLHDLGNLDLWCPRDLVVTYSQHLSLSRLNHWLPRIQAHPEVVQGTAEFHHQITDPLLPQADPVLHDAAALDTAIDMLDPQPPLVERLVHPLVLPRELLAAGFLGRHEDRHLRERERQEPQILQEPAPRR